MLTREYYWLKYLYISSIYYTTTRGKAPPPPFRFITSRTRLSSVIAGQSFR